MDRRKPAASDDEAARAKRLDQFYTKDEVAAALYAIVLEHCDPITFQMVDPSAGKGAFWKLMPADAIAVDRDPKHPGILEGDFFDLEIRSDRPIAVIGNPPFGRNSSLAKRFFNRAARQAQIIGFILPKSFRKVSTINQLDQAFHLVREEPVPDDAFVFLGRPRNVPAVFQIWERRKEPRGRIEVETRHPDFAFTTPKLADFAIQRVGADAGRVHHDPDRSDSSHYFIKGPVEAIMRQLDFAGAAANVASVPSLAKSEIVSLYRAWLERNWVPQSRISSFRPYRAGRTKRKAA